MNICSLNWIVLWFRPPSRWNETFPDLALGIRRAFRQFIGTNEENDRLSTVCCSNDIYNTRIGLKSVDSFRETEVFYGPCGGVSSVLTEENDKAKQSSLMEKQSHPPAGLHHTGSAPPVTGLVHPQRPRGRRYRTSLQIHSGVASLNCAILSHFLILIPFAAVTRQLSPHLKSLRCTQPVTLSLVFESHNYKDSTLP